MATTIAPAHKVTTVCGVTVDSTMAPATIYALIAETTCPVPADCANQAEWELDTSHYDLDA